ncbi:hypothetical protein [Nannocystis punicea]|uniref:Uncharacterized protein n=1 Tax=Nannocystis punicea TaxID=2995304 RepID=A0ABY7GXM4_9BACT|nr:hypothetical protein [Nannocystis poenicansa]WAS91569.1 hypothetical protein O0S08_35765 [Nannocystis poenicansa]
MPTTATIIFTALPNGLVQMEGGQALRLSVFVSPRLGRTEPPQEGESPAPLTDYPDLAVWPDVVATMNWAVRISPQGGGDDLELPAQAAPKSLDSPLWQAIFPTDHPVPRYRFDDELATLPVVSYPAGALADHVQNSYAELGAKFSRDLPPAWRLEDSQQLGPITRISTQVLIPQPFMGSPTSLEPDEVVGLGRRETTRGARKERIASVRNELGETETNYLLLRAFYHRVPAGAPYLPPPQLDFHQIVSTLGNYPALLRRLGLVVDLVVPLPSPLPVVPALVRVRPEWTQQGLVDLRAPRTLMGPDFRPLASDAADIAAGYLRLESAWPTVQDGRFQLCRLDVDGAGLQLLSLAETLWANVHTDAPLARPASLPALRSAGLGVLRRDRGEQLEKNVDRSMDLQNTPGATDELRAEDVLRGLRVDVFDETTKEWRSLHAQVGAYEIEGRTIQQPEEEGFTEPAATRPFAPKGAPEAPDGAPADALEVHEKLFSWEGWSLSVAPEGKAHPQDERPAPPNPPPPPRAIVKAKFEVVPGSLPRLRFGRSYRLRARTVDLAGNSIRLQDAGEEHASPSERYLRLEPVDAPVVLPVLEAEKAYPPGESLERLVIRSERDGQPIELPKKTRPVRILAPPPTSQRTAEMHGVFDKQLDWARMYAQDGKPAPADLLLKKVYQFIVEHDQKLPEWVASHALAEAQAGLPRYLPDPLAFGVAVRTLPDETAWVQSFYSTGERTSAAWEEPRPIRLTLARVGLTEQAEAKWSSKRRELTVRLRPSQVLRLDCSSCLCPEDLDLLQVWHWIVEASPTLADAELDAIRGGLWMLTPKRELFLVHAVRQPLLRPRLEHLDEQTASRRCGETALTFHDLPCKKPVLSVHQASTSRVDVMAEYREPVDDPSSADGTRWLEGRERAFDVFVPAPPELGIAGELGLPRTALSLAAEKEKNPGDPSVMLPLYRHEFGDTKYRRVRYHAVATTRFREYFEPVRGAQPSDAPLSAEEAQFALAGDEVTIDVPSTARPLGVKVAYGIPTFAWSRGGGLLAEAPPQQEPSPEVRQVLGFSSLMSPEDVRWSERKGNALRIYIEGSWWSSGEGETLGVILAPEGREDVGNYLPYVSTWGTDPVWKEPGRYPRWDKLPGQLPGLRQFPRAVACHEGAQLAELAGPDGCGEPGGGALPVAVAGHAVAFDPIRKLWYCDLEIDVGAVYFPFVRLALARFQPHSVAGVHLSSVTTMDFLQVAPNRILTVASRELEDTPQLPGACATPWARTELDVTLLGPGPEIQANEVRLDVQVQRTLAEGDFGWVTLSSPDAEVRPQAPPPGALFRAIVRVPAADAGGAPVPTRLLVQEYERHVEDALEPSEGAQPDPRREPGLRLVYAEIVHLRAG